MNGEAADSPIMIIQYSLLWVHWDPGPLYRMIDFGWKVMWRNSANEWGVTRYSQCWIWFILEFQEYMWKTGNGVNIILVNYFYFEMQRSSHLSDNLYCRILQYFLQMQ